MSLLSQWFVGRASWQFVTETSRLVPNSPLLTGPQLDQNPRRYSVLMPRDLESLSPVIVYGGSGTRSPGMRNWFNR
jgi:hypothetical protein